MDITFTLASISEYLEGCGAHQHTRDFWKRLLAALLENDSRLKIYGFGEGEQSSLTLAGLKLLLQDIQLVMEMLPSERSRWAILNPEDRFVSILVESEGRRASELHPFLHSMYQAMPQAA